MNPDILKAFESSNLDLRLLIWLPPIITVLVLWSAFWKGLALWHSARREKTGWFILLLFVNTLGLLEMVFLFGIAKLKFNELFSKKT